MAHADMEQRNAATGTNDPRQLGEEVTEIEEVAPYELFGSLETALSLKKLAKLG
jgi:hypothetical protein